MDLTEGTEREKEIRRLICKIREAKVLGTRVFESDRGIEKIIAKLFRRTSRAQDFLRSLELINVEMEK